MARRLLARLSARRAANGMEYALVFGAVATLAVLAITSLGTEVTRGFFHFSARLENGSQGATIAPEPVYDRSPDGFTLGTIGDLTAGQTVQSATVTPSGFDTAVPVSVTGGATLIINGAPAGASAQIAPGSTLAVSWTAPAAYEQSATVTLSIGAPAITVSWTVSTKTQDSTPDAFAFNAETGLALNASRSAGPVILAGFDGPLTLSWSGAADAIVTVNGAPAGGSSLPVNPGDQLSVAMAASGSYATAKTLTLTLGSHQTGWSLTTRPEFYASCLEAYNAGMTTNGTYVIGSGGGTSVYCDMTNGGWTVIVGNAAYASGNFPFSTKAGTSFSYGAGQFVARQGSSASGNCHVPLPAITTVIPFPITQVQWQFTGRQHNVAGNIGMRIDMNNDGSYEYSQNHCTASGQRVVCTSNYANTHTAGSQATGALIFLNARSCQNFDSSNSALLTVIYLAVK